MQDTYGTVVKEFAPIGDLRVRLMDSNGARKLDVREYIDGGGRPGAFDGFTRKGIRLDEEGIQDLFQILSELMAAPVRVVCQNTLPPAVTVKAPAAPAPAPAKARKAPAPARSYSAAAPSDFKARAAELAPKAAAKDHPAVAAIKARMAKGETVPLMGPGSLAEAYQTAARTPAAAHAPAPAPVKPAPAPAADPAPTGEQIRKVLDKPLSPGRTVGESILGDILEETAKGQKVC